MVCRPVRGALSCFSPSSAQVSHNLYAAHLREAGDTIAEIVAKTGITCSSLYATSHSPAGTLTAAGIDQAPA